MRLESFIDEILELKSSLGASNNMIQSVSIKNETTVIETDASELVMLVSLLREHRKFGFSQLTDIVAVDFMSRQPRFELTYVLLSVTNVIRCFVKIKVGEDQIVPTVTSAYSAALWCEREVWDMFGIPFGEHPDLRRILSDYHFTGFPLRKDFPLVGHTEAYYDPNHERVCYRPVRLQQEFRDFNFTSPWQGYKGV